MGYLTSEFDALGVEFGDRAALVDDALVAMKAAWTGDPVHHVGIGYSANDTLVLPRPTQRPHPPIWVGGNSRAAMRRAVQHGQGWSPMPSPKAASAFLGTPGLEGIGELAARIAELHQLASDAGRTDPSTSPSSRPAVGVRRRHVEHRGVDRRDRELRTAGGTVLVINLPGTTLTEFTENVAQFADTVLPHV